MKSHFSQCRLWTMEIRVSNIAKPKTMTAHVVTQLEKLGDLKPS